MKSFKNFIMLLSILLVQNSVKAMSVSVSGSQATCTGGTYWYTATVSKTAPEVYQEIIWTCSGNGVFASTGTTTMTLYPSGGSFSWSALNVQVNWTGSNAIGWVSARVMYSAGGFNYQKTGVLDYIQIGFPYGGPTAINNLPLAICNSKTSAYYPTCPNGLSGNATAYDWYATGGGTGSGSSSTGTVTPAANNTSIVVYVRFVGCGTYSPSYSVTVPRAIGTPAPVTAWFDVVNDDGIHCFNHAFTGGGSYPTSYVWTQPSSQTTTTGENTRNLGGGGTYSISVMAVNDCGTSSALTYTGQAQTCAPKFPDITNTKEEFNDVTLYPNPASASASVLMQLPNHKNEAHITIMNMAGQLVQDFYTADVKFSIETLNIPTGLYMVSATADEFSKNQKLEIIR
jgi:hypothetical protein